MRALGAAALVTLGLPAAAGAADYGGGTPADLGLTLVSVRTAVDGSARVGAKVAAGCGVGNVTRAVQLAADGTFGFSATVRRGAGDGVRQTTRIALSGQVTSASASGTVTARLTFRRGGRVVERCSATRAWSARAAAAEPAAGPPVSAGAYYGLTSQRAPFVLRVDPAATRVRTAAFEYVQTCRREPFEWENITPGAPVAADGTFRLRERFSFRWKEGRERYRVKVDGRFTTTGVSGTLSVSSVLRSPSGRVVDRCRTGRTTFAAVL